MATTTGRKPAKRQASVTPPTPPSAAEQREHEQIGRRARHEGHHEGWHEGFDEGKRAGVLEAAYSLGHEHGWGEGWDEGWGEALRENVQLGKIASLPPQESREALREMLRAHHRE